MFRIYVERKAGFQNEAARISKEIVDFLGITGLRSLRYLNRYDVENVSEQNVKLAAVRIFSEPQSDSFVFDTLSLQPEDKVIVWEYLPGQYDQRSDSAQQCLSLLLAGLEENLSQEERGNSALAPKVRCAKMVILRGDLSLQDIEKIQKYLINPVDSRLASTEKPATLEMALSTPEDIPVFQGFIDFNESELKVFYDKMGLAMDMADLSFLQQYFKKEGRNPTETEIKVLDTYWSDHCRHTTFNTILDDIAIEEGDFSQRFKKSLDIYKELRTALYQNKDKPVTLMDMAVIGAKYLKKQGLMDHVEVSEEINACSVYIDVEYTHPQPATEKWLLMFKNETHNHPTEIEPFGGAATCIGGAIRDPLSGRSWVYQALRVTGAADPRRPLSETREGKLPQMKLTREAASGFSSYGNQIGLTTGQVAEIYHPGFEAKRMELGAVIAAAPAAHVVRQEPRPGDIVVLVGGGTGRDGIGGATGSSKVHTTQSVIQAAAEVQKGNAVEERKIQRLFRNPEVSKKIRRCNDFGAGGVAVAVGELAPGLQINLDAVPKKYEGLNGTELAISESQERMALVVAPENVEFIMTSAAAENLNAAVIAEVTDTNRLIMSWRGKVIVDIDREFLDTAGAQRSAKAFVYSPVKADSPLIKPLDSVSKVLTGEATPEKATTAWKTALADLACCSQRGLGECFDGSIGAASVLFPYGGRYQGTPEAGMVAKIPVTSPYETKTVSFMSYGYDPRVAQWSPWHGAQIAVLSSLAKIGALGGNPADCSLTFQEYFERTASPEAWGKPTAALLGALEAQKATKTGAIGGKDSMSGSFQDLKVPPTLVSFAVTTGREEQVRGGSFTETSHPVYMITVPYTGDLAPDFEVFNKNMQALQGFADNILAAYPVGAGGIAEALTKMSLGNKIGVILTDTLPMPTLDALGGQTSSLDSLFLPAFGSVLVEAKGGVSPVDFMAAGFAENTVYMIGSTTEERAIQVVIPGMPSFALDLDDLEKTWEEPLSKVFPPVSSSEKSSLEDFALSRHNSWKEARENKKSSVTILKGAKPKVLLPVFPGTNCEFDMERAFNLAGGDSKILVFRNNTPQALADSLEALEHELKSSQILALSGGFSAGDEPDGSGKFIANVLRSPAVAREVMALLEKRDGLVLGICNGFQALIKTGLVPYGRIMEPAEDMPTLTFNTIGRHISRIARTRIVSLTSPWSQHPSLQEDAVHLVPISHGEGRIIMSRDFAKELFEKGQVFTQYVDTEGAVAVCEPDNPNGSAYAIEGLTSPDGRVLGKMGHSERTVGTDTWGSCGSLIKNVAHSGKGSVRESSCQNIFAAGVSYFA